MTVEHNKECYPMSPLQEGMLFHALSSSGSGVDIEQILCTIYEDLDPVQFERAWMRVVERHPILRTRFQWEGISDPLQIVEPHVELQVNFHDWKKLTSESCKKQMAEFMKKDRLLDFKMNKAPLMRLSIFEIDGSAYQFLWTFHHALLDGRSFPIVLRDLFSFYEAMVKDRTPTLEKIKSYREYIEWQQRQDLSKAKIFWQQTLNGFTTPTRFFEKTTPYAGSAKAGTVSEELQLSEALSAQLRSMAKDHDLTLHTLIQGAWAILLSHYSNNDDVVFGTTRACRHSTIDGAESMVGLFINTLPIRVQVRPELPLLSFLRQLREQNLSLREYENTPLSDIQQCSEVPSGIPLFDSILVYEEGSLNNILRSQKGKWLKREFLYRGQTNYPLTVIGYGDNEILLRIEYNSDRFDQLTIRRMIGHMHTLLESIISNPQLQIMSLPYMTHSEKHQILYEWNPAWSGDSVEQCVHQKFEQQVKTYPNRLALIFEEQILTYKELNIRANRLAHQLRGLGVGPESHVGLCVQRSLDMVIGILGILKSGGAYIPLDPAYPKERLAFILEDIQAPVLVTQQRLVADLPDHSAAVVCIDNDQIESVYSSPKTEENPNSGVNPDNLAYVIYTSGSTGKPKGVMVTHGNMMRLFDATDAWYKFGPQDVWTLFHSYAFDFSVWEIWGALLYGGRLVIIPYEVSRSPSDFYKLLIDEQVTVLNQTPSAFYQLIQADEIEPSEDNLALRLVIFGGEALELKNLKPWFKRHGDKKPHLVNMYGITETTVHVTYRPITNEDVEDGLGSVIGEPIPDLQLYVLDRNLRPVPIGVTGELFVGGAGLARGYMNRPELTEERFIPNPFNNEPGRRLYKTGDLARFLANRDLEYLGRADHQVQIRGFRVELGEIETVLLDHENVNQAVVVVRGDQATDQRLVAYFVSKTNQSISSVELRKHLQAQLPEYMIPQYFIELESIPLTQNGKIDRRALPEPKLDRQTEETFVAPRNEVERIIAGIWQQLLNIEKIGIQDNFFEMGGHSLLLVRMLNKLKKSFKKEFSIVEMFRHPTIATLADFVTQKQEAPTSFATTFDLVQKQRESLKKRRAKVRRNSHDG